MLPLLLFVNFHNLLIDVLFPMFDTPYPLQYSHEVSPGADFDKEIVILFIRWQHIVCLLSGEMCALDATKVTSKSIVPFVNDYCH